MLDKFNAREPIDLIDFVENIPLETYLNNACNVFDMPDN